MKIDIQNLTHVLVDGQPQGGIVDVFFNAAYAGKEDLRAPLLDALLAREAELQASGTSELEAAVKAAQVAAQKEQATTVSQLVQKYEGALLELNKAAAATSQELEVAQREASSARAEKDKALQETSQKLTDASAREQELTRGLDALTQREALAQKSLLEKEAIRAETEKELMDSRSFSNSVLANAGEVLADGTLTDEERKSLLIELHNYATLPAREREALAAEVQAKALLDKAAELRANP